MNDPAGKAGEAGEAGEQGTGGLTFEPPRARDDDEPPIGFAEGLDEEAGELAGGELSFSEAAPSPVADAVASARARRAPPRYPLAEAALARLLGDDDEAAARARPGDDGAAFVVGPAVTRPPPAIARPAPDLDLAPPEGSTSADTLLDDMVDVMLVGGDDDGKQHVHLAFKGDVFGGLYLKLERTAEGLFATFLVHSDGDRRGVEGHVDALLARLRARGMRIKGHAVEVRAD